MEQPTRDKQELLKQNFELTLIIIFIGLAFGLVGLVVPTAAVMSVVVISVGVIVGFVSYRDAFIPQPTSQAAINPPAAQKLPVSSPPPRLAPKPAPSTPPQPAPTPAAPAAAPRLEQKPAPQSKPIEEALPRLPKIQRLPESGGATFPSQARPPNPAPHPASPQAASEPAQARDTKSRKSRARKTVEVPSLKDEKNA
jgi:hypothetical protein